APERLLACSYSGGSARNVAMNVTAIMIALLSLRGEVRSRLYSNRPSSQLPPGPLRNHQGVLCGANSWMVVIAFLGAAVLISTPAPPQTTRPSSAVENSNHPAILFVQAATVKEGNLSERFPAGSRIVRLEEGIRRPTNLTPYFFSAAEPRISF